MSKITGTVTPLALISAINDIDLKAETALQQTDVVSTYQPSGTAPVNGTAITEALGSTKIQYEPFAINSGNSFQGSNTTLSYSGADLFCTPCTITNTEGITKSDIYNSIINVSSLSNGTYKVYKSMENNSLALLPSYSVSITAPENPTDGYYWLDSSTVPASFKEYITPNYSVVGTPTISGSNIVSDFSNSNYITKALNFSSTDTWEIQIPFTTSSNITTVQRVIDRASSNSTNYITVNVGGSVCGIALSVDGTSIFSIPSQTFNVLANTSYLVKIGYDGTNYYIKYNTGGSDTNVSTSTSAILWNSEVLHNIGRGDSSLSNPFLGSMDFNSFKVYINGSLDSKSSFSNIANFIEGGNPVITNGIATVINQWNYVYPNVMSLPSNYDTFDIYFGDFIFSSFTGNEWLVVNAFGANGDAVLDGSTAGFMMRTSYGGTTAKFLSWGGNNGWNIWSSQSGSINHYEDINKPIGIRLVFTGSQYILYSKVGEGSWQTELTVSSSAKIASSPIIIGGGTSSSHPSVDISKFEITVNNQEYYQLQVPSGWITKNNLVDIGSCTVSSGVITSVKNRPFNACPYKRDLVESYQNGTSWCAIYSDDWCEQGGVQQYNGATGTVSFTQPYRTFNSCMGVITTNSSSNSNSANVTSFSSSSFNYSVGGSSDFTWRAYGYV